MIEVMPGVNFWVDACRFRDTLVGAVDNRTPRMKTMAVVQMLGIRSGIRVRTGAHVIKNVRRALAKPDVSYRGVTREAWSQEDIDSFVALIYSAVTATGGRTDVGTISHDAAIGQAKFSGAPDGEDHQVLVMAVQFGATALATSDDALLRMGAFAGVEIWNSKELDDEVNANIRRLQRQPQPQ